ncbi:MAG: hypothetical protein JRG86_16655 [Deltaproteobacteria bacterium]|jgi:predicted NUDIX family NTP pyrophosphohydrolase|nr:hypothetical protein [Deltaproteobacteria bacterium]MBW2499500.1 hypothetical protein [Deltaproteobacteria bacterium]
MLFRIGALLIAYSFVVGAPARAESPSPAEVAQRLGLSQDAIERVRKGEVVVQEIEASSDKDLTMALVAAFAAPLSRVEEFVSTEQMAELSTVTISRGDIDTKTFSLAAMELPDDVLSQLVKDPGGTFFMSKDEAARVKQAAKQGKAQALDAYREVLSARAKAYWEGGLAAIEPYAGKGRSPKVDLGHANEAARKLLSTPAVLAALDAIPAKADGSAVHKLEWAVQKGRDQAAPILSHRILYTADDAVVVVDRRFYSGYDYDALQIVAGGLPASEGRTAVVYTTHTYTAQVAGFGGGAKRSIGRKLMSKELIAELERAQKAVVQGS